MVLCRLRVIYTRELEPDQQFAMIGRSGDVRGGDARLLSIAVTSCPRQSALSSVKRRAARTQVLGDRLLRCPITLSAKSMNKRYLQHTKKAPMSRPTNCQLDTFQQ